MSETSKKSSVIQAVKAVAVLVIICLVCVALLALFNDVFYISDEERARRAELKINKSLKEVYPNFEQDASFDGTLNSQFATNPSYGSVSKAVKSTDGAFIIAASDAGVGYGKTPLTVLVAISKDAEIVAWKISDGGAETQLDNLKGVEKSWYIGQNISSAFEMQKVAGTTMSSRAIYNAIQMACFYAINALHLGSNPEGDAKEAVTALLASNNVTGVELTTVVGVLNATVTKDKKISDYLSDGADTVSYMFTGKNGETEITAYVYGAEENLKLVVLHGADVFTSENVTSADAIYGKALAFRYVSMTFAGATLSAAIVEADSTSANGEMVYTVVGFAGKGYVPGKYTLKVTVENVEGAGSVKAIEVVVSGYAPYDLPESDANILATSGLIGATSATVDGMYNANKVSGVTQSANIITVAVKAVLAQYDADIAE